MNLLTPEVTNGLIGASSYVKLAGVSMNVYQAAKLRGDGATMERASGYAQEALDKASISGDDAQQALQDAQTETSAQIRAELKTAADHINNAPVRGAAHVEMTAADTVGEDIVEISRSALVSAGTAVPPQTSSGGGIYTEQAAIKQPASGSSISIAL